MPGWRLPSNMPPDDLRGLPRRSTSRSSLVWLVAGLFGLIVLGLEARDELAHLLAWTAAQRKEWTIEGRVVDARTGAALPGVWVRVGSTGARYLAFRPLPTPVWKTGRTADDGSFRVRTHLLGDPILYFQLAGYEDGLLQPDTTAGIVEALTPVAPR